MTADYQLWVNDRYGNRQAVVGHEALTKLVYTRSVNAVGSLVAEMARDVVPDDLIVEDAQVEVWRRPQGGTWRREGEAIWLVQGEARGVSQDGGRYRRIKAVSANHILTRRIVNGSPGSATALKTGFACDIMKQYVAEAGVGTWSWDTYTASRGWTALAIQALDGFGKVVAKDASYRNLFTTLQEVCRDASSVVYTFFDVVAAGAPGVWEFRTYIGSRGVNRAGQIGTGGVGQLTISAERGNLGGAVETEIDWEDAASVVVGGGQGQGANRVIQPYGSTRRVGATAYGLREVFLNASQATTGAAVGEEAVAELRRLQPHRTLTGTLLDVPGTRYGVDWNWGDIVRAEFEGLVFSAWIDSVTVTLDRGAETIAPVLRAQPEPFV